MGTRTCIQLAFLHGALCHILWPRAARLLTFDGKSTPNPKVPCNSRWFATNKASVWLGVVGLGGVDFFSPWVFVSFFQTWVGFWFPVAFRNSLTYLFAEAWDSRFVFFLAKIETERRMGQKISPSKSFRLTWRYTYIYGLQIVSL